MNPISSLLLRMSESAAWQRRLIRWSATRRVVSRFMPGEELDDAVAAVEQLNMRGMAASLNPVGEHVADEAEAATAAEQYVRILHRIHDENLDSNLSVKLSLLGFDLGRSVAVGHLRSILDTAQSLGNFVRIDMEGAAYVTPTLEIYDELRGHYPDLGIVIQSYLRRSPADADELAASGAAVRLVKGAYKEPPEIAFERKPDVDRTFIELLERLLDEEARAAGVRLAVATHDPALVEHTKRVAEQRGIDDNLEFQFLYGIGRPLQEALTAEGYAVRIYVSYGKAWYPWFMRRLAERPANLGFFLRHMFS